MELIQEYPHFIWSLALIVGLIFGSFGNVIIARLPKMLERQWHRDSSDQQATENRDEATFNLAYPASHCPHCSAPIRWFDNLPLVSYLILRGQCRDCGTAISIRYPLTELLTGLLVVMCVTIYGVSTAAFVYALFLYILLLLTLIDSEHMLLPDQLTLPLLWAGLLLSLHILPISPAEAILGAAGGYLSLWSVYWLFFLLTKKEGLGYGDFKLLAALGAWLGWQSLPLIILISSLLGALVGIILMIAKRHTRGNPIPFGPFLAIAAVIALFFGDSIYHMYWSLYP